MELLPNIWGISDLDEDAGVLQINFRSGTKFKKKTLNQRSSQNPKRILTREAKIDWMKTGLKTKKQMPK